MLKRCASVALVALIGLALPALGQDKPVNLKWEWKKGATFYQTMETTTSQTIRVMGSDIKQTQNQTFYYSWTPDTDASAGGNQTLKQKIEGVKMQIDIGGSKIEFDSTRDTAANNSLAEFFKALVGSEFTVTLDKDFKATDIKGKDEFIKKLSNANPQMDALLKQILSDKAMKEMVDPTFAAVPNKEVKKGDKWTRTSDLDMGPIGTYKTTYNYTYDGPDPKDAKLQLIKVDADLTYTKPAANTTGATGLPFKITDANIPATKANGTITFDTDKHWVAKSEITMDLKGDLTIDIGGQATKVELQQSQKTTVTTSDQNPVKK